MLLDKLMLIHRYNRKLCRVNGLAGTQSSWETWHSESSASRAAAKSIPIEIKCITWQAGLEPGSGDGDWQWLF